MTGSGKNQNPEQLARDRIDSHLASAGWRVQNMKDLEWSAGRGIAVREYQGLLEMNAEDTKSGAGQYFTPRALIKAMVECVRPEPGKSIADPAFGTGGIFLACYDFLTNPAHYELDRAQKTFLKRKTFYGNESSPIRAACA
jgi:type I restriction enzyme M protein